MTLLCDLDQSVASTRYAMKYTVKTNNHCCELLADVKPKQYEWQMKYRNIPVTDQTRGIITCDDRRRLYNGSHIDAS